MKKACPSFLLFLCLLGAAACTGPERIRQQCLIVPTYTLRQQQALAHELEQHCPGGTVCDVPEMVRRVTDYYAVQRENALCWQRAAP